MSLDVDKIYRRYNPTVLRRCRRLLRDEEDAVDAMHDVFVRLTREQSRLHGDALRTLLFRMATNICLDRMRHRKRRPETPSDELVETIAALDRPDARALAARMLDRIFARERSTTRVIAVLHVVDGMTIAEVAEVVDMPATRVRERIRSLQRRARKLEETTV